MPSLNKNRFVFCWRRLNEQAANSPKWLAKADLDANRAVQENAAISEFERAFRAATEPGERELMFGDLARGATTNNSMFRVTGIELPNELRPQKPTAMPKLRLPMKAISRTDPGFPALPRRLPTPSERASV